MLRTDRRSRVEKGLRFRKIGDARWLTGRAERMSRSHLLFTTVESVEVGDKLELVLLEEREQARSHDVQSGEVVRRVLMNWPNLDILIGVRLADDDVRPPFDAAA